jgi:site-specific DNA recombinase
VIRLLTSSGRKGGGAVERVWEEIEQLQQTLREKGAERDRVIGLYRRGRINEATLDQQLDEIEREERAIQAELGEMEERARMVAATGAHLASTEELLEELNARLDEPLTWELKRALVETLVASIRVETVEQEGRKAAVVTTRYHFVPTATCTGTGSWPRRE